MSAPVKLIATGVFAVLFGLGLGFVTAGSGAPIESARNSDEMREGVLSALQHPDPVIRELRFMRLMRDLSPDTVAGAAAAMDMEIGRISECEIRPFVTAWSRFDDQAAFRHVGTWEYEPKFAFGVSEAVAHLASTDRVEQAIQISEKLQRPERILDEIRTGLIDGWVRSDGVDPPVRYLANASAPSNVVDPLQAVLRLLYFEGGLERIEGWVDTLPEEFPRGFRTKAARAAIRWMSSLDPAEAARWYDGHASAGTLNLASVAVAAEWMEHDPDAALDWLTTLPAGRDRDTAVRTSVQRLIVIDPEGSLATLQRLRDEPALEPGVDSFVQHLARMGRADEAIEWVDAFYEGGQRGSARVRIVVEWHRHDAAEAQAWMDEARVSAAFRNRVEGELSKSILARGVSPVRTEEGGR